MRRRKEGPNILFRSKAGAEERQTQDRGRSSSGGSTLPMHPRPQAWRAPAMTTATAASGAQTAERRGRERESLFESLVGHVRRGRSRDGAGPSNGDFDSDSSRDARSEAAAGTTLRGRTRSAGQTQHLVSRLIEREKMLQVFISNNNSEMK